VHGVYVTETCDKCGTVLGPIRWALRDEPGAWCSQKCRDGEEHRHGVCRGCGTPLAGKRRGAIYCGRTCRMRTVRKAIENPPNIVNTPIANKGLTGAICELGYKGQPKHRTDEPERPGGASRTNMKTREATAATLRHSKSRLATKEEANNLDREATEILKTLKTGWLSLGLVVKKMVETRAFEQLGFTSMRAWMESRFREQLASAYQALRAVRALEGIPIAQLERIGTRNAQVIARLPEKERRSNEWLAKAADLPERQLKAEVDALIETKTGMVKEKFRHWGEAVPESIAEKLEEMMAKIGRVLQVDVSERSGRITALEALAAMIANTPEDQLKAETEGGEAA
jgi:hypothetical protein